MPALNIDFTDEELARIRERAHAKGMSMSRLVHDTAIECADREAFDQRVVEETDRVIRLSRELLERLKNQ